MYFCERLRDDHDLASFASGKAELDDWLVHAALHADRSGTSRTYVVIDASHHVLSYFALAPHVVRRSDVPRKAAHGAPDAIPSILLARLAVAEHLHGRGLGGAVLAHALAISLEGMQKAGGRLIVVDAIDGEAASFYVHHGFVAVPGNPHRLVMKASVAARSLGMQWP